MHAFLYTGLHSSVASLLQSGVQAIAFDLDSKRAPRNVIVRTDSESSMKLHNDDVMATTTLCKDQAAHVVYLCIQAVNGAQPAVSIEAYHSMDGADFELHHPSATPRGSTNWSMWRWRQPRLGMLKLVVTPGDSRTRVFNYVACVVRCVHETAPCNAGATRASKLEIFMPARFSHQDPWILNEIKVYASESVDGEERLLQPLSITVMHGRRAVACFNPFSISNPGLYGLKQFPTGASLCIHNFNMQRQPAPHG